MNLTSFFFKTTFTALLISCTSTFLNAQKILFEDTKHFIHYELQEGNVIITVEDLLNTSYESTAIPDSSALDFVLLHFDHDQNGIINTGIDQYYTVNALNTNGICVGNIENTNKTGACSLSSSGTATASIIRTPKSNTDHLVYQFTIPLSELTQNNNLCTRIGFKIHTSGDPKNVATSFPSSATTSYFVAHYYPIQLYPDIDLGDDFFYCEGDTVQPSASYPNYLWNNNSTDSFLVPNDSSSYSLTVKDNTCSISDTVFVAAGSDYFCSGVQISFPSIVTPNNDGLNDYFEPLPHSALNSFDFSQSELNIYNRWGIQVGGKKGTVPFWDCYLDWGQKASSGTYFYSYSPTGNTSDVINGFFTILYTER